MPVVQGGCHCGNLSYRAEFANALSIDRPRACDCGFCASHGASYVSDRDGSLSISIQDEGQVSRYRLGTRIAEFLVCSNCGVLIGACYREGEHLYGSINTRSARMAGFGQEQAVELTRLTDEARIERWKQIWFPNVMIECGCA